MPSAAPYGYGSGPNVGIRSKLCTGTGDGSSHSIDFDPHGFGPTGTRANTCDQTKFAMKISIDPPRTNAEYDTQALPPCR